jgi:hypothetical protein
MEEVVEQIEAGFGPERRVTIKPKQYFVEGEQ